MRINHRTIIAIAVLSVLPVCGYATTTFLSGTYGPPDGQMAITLNPDGAALLRMNGQSFRVRRIVASGLAAGHGSA